MRWKPYLTRVAPERLRAVSEQVVRRRRVRLLQQDAARRERERSRDGSARVNILNGNLGEMLGKLYVEQPLQARGQGAHGGNSSPTCARLSRDGIDRLEWMGPETKKQAQEKLAKFRRRSAIRSKWRDYSKLRDQQGRSRRQHHARLSRRERVISSARSASRSTPRNGA